MTRIDTSKRSKDTYLMLIPVPLLTVLWAALVTFLLSKVLPVWGAILIGVTISPILVGITFLVFGSILLSLYNDGRFDNLVQQFSTHTEIPPHIREAAIQCFQEAGRLEKSTRVYSLLAPVVMFYVLPFVGNKNERLPKWLHKFDNDVNRYGDGGGVLRDGVWLDDRTHPEVYPLREGEKWLAHKDPDYKGDSYFAPGFYVRGFISQYVWLGWRNTASQANLDLAVKLDSRPALIYGINDSGTRKEGFGLYKYKDKYQYMAHYRAKILGKDVVIRRNVGYKLNLALYRAEDDLRGAQPVYIVWSFKRWKGDR